MKTWDAPTLARFLALVRDDRHQPAWLFLATTGCRRGEALGLRWTDVDLDIGNVVIYQTVSAIDHDLRTAPRRASPGRSGSTRPPSPPSAPSASARRRSGYCSVHDFDDDLVFARPDGRPQHPELLERVRAARRPLPAAPHPAARSQGTRGRPLPSLPASTSRSCRNASVTPAPRSPGTSTSTSRRPCRPTPPRLSPA